MGKGNVLFSDFLRTGDVMFSFMYSYLVDDLCRNVGVRLAEVHAVHVEALYRDLAEEAAATLLTAAVRDCLSDGDQTWLLGHVPEKQKEVTVC